NTSGSLTRRMIVVAAVWIVILLGLGGYALDRVLTAAVTDNFDAQADYVLTALIASSEIGPDNEIFLNRPPADQRFLEPYSGLYFQITGRGHEPFRSRSLWDRALPLGEPHVDDGPHVFDNRSFPGETLRIVE